MSADVNFYQGFQWMIPIPVNSTYVSSSLSSTTATWPAGTNVGLPSGSTTPSSFAGGSQPFTVTYCTGAVAAPTSGPGTGCTAIEPSASNAETFSGNTPTPYLEIGTPGYGTTVIGADEIPAGATVTFPTVSVVLAASGTVGSTIQPALTEYDSAADVTVAGGTLEGLTLMDPISTWPTAPLTAAQESTSNTTPPPLLLTPLSTTTIAAPVPPPTITGVFPTGGEITGGTPVIITGTNLEDATVDFGTTAAIVTADTATSITAESSAGANLCTLSIDVTTPGGTTVYTPPIPLLPPVLTGISPVSGSTAGGTTVMISGTGLSCVTAVEFGTTTATITSDTATSITATSPPGSPGAVSVTADAADGPSNPETFTYVAPPTGKAPVVKLVFPKSGTTAGGRLVLIEGSNFTGATSVDFGVEPALFLVLTPNWIVSLSPSGPAGVANVMVTNGVGTSATSVSDQFTYEG